MYAVVLIHDIIERWTSGVYLFPSSASINDIQYHILIVHKHDAVWHKFYRHGITIYFFIFSGTIIYLGIHINLLVGIGELNIGDSPFPHAQILFL